MHTALEQALCRLHQRSYCVTVSSATTGLALTMKTMDLAGSGVAIPSGVCLNVPLSVHYAGAVPVYCDIDVKTLGLTPSTLAAAGFGFSAVVAIHAYGNTCDINTLEAYCRQKSLPLIEDVAAAQGAAVGDRPAGSFGAASILSFGAGKIIDIGCGGAVLTDDPHLAHEIRERHSRLIPRQDEDVKRLGALSAWHTRLYNQHWGRDLAMHIKPFAKAALALKAEALTYARWDAGKVLQQLRHLEANLGRRRRLSAYFYNRMTRRTGVRCPPPSAGSAPWRACIFISGCRDQVLRALLDERMNISSWYPPAQYFLDSEAPPSTPVASQVGEEILNVWVNKDADIEYLDKISAKIFALTHETQ